jgi:hypothetical protein
MAEAHPTILRDAVRRLMERGVQAAGDPSFAARGTLLVLDRWFTAFE